MKVVLLRHGQTAGNQKRRYHGRTDEPLCEQGMRQAREAGILTHVTKVFVSPMLRARQTAAICFPFAEQVVISDLREMDFGDFEGRTPDEMTEDEAYRAWVDGNCEGPCPNGESLTGFQTRVGAAFDAMVRKALEAGEKSLYMVAHGGTIMAVMSVFVEEPNSYYDWFVGNCEGWQAVLEEETWLQQPRLTHYRSLREL